MHLPLLMVHGSKASQVVFICLCSAILIAFLVAAIFCQTSKPAKFYVASLLTASIAMYCIAIICVVNSGVFTSAFVPAGPIFFFGTIAIATGIGFTSLGQTMSARIPVVYLVGFQSFRLPLELVLHDWYKSGTIPETMTWTGSNWDIATGILACLSCAFVINRQWIAWLVNIVGIVLLANVGRVAIMSAPVPFGWNVEPPLELILYLPYAFIVPICVGGAAFGHVLLTRRLLSY